MNEKETANVLHALRGQTAIVEWPKLFLREYTDYPKELLDDLEDKSLPKIKHWNKFATLIKLGICGYPLKSPTISDEPKFFGFSSLSHKNPFTGNSDAIENMGEYGHGFNRSEMIACISSMAECIERSCLRLIPGHSWMVGNARELSKTHKIINLKKLINYQSSQHDSFQLADLRSLDQYEFKWVNALDLVSGGEILIPAQAVYVPTTFEPFKDEPVLRYPISTGAAFGTNADYSDAILRGLLECIERDGNMLAYLSQNPLPRIIVDVPQVKKLIAYFRRYGLTVDLFYSATDLGIPSVIAILRDTLSQRPYLSIGSSAHLNATDAVLGAIREAQQVRNLLRTQYLLEKNPKIPSPLDIDSVHSRCLYWSGPEKETHLRFLLDSSREIKLSEIKSIQANDDKDGVRQIISRLAKKGYSACMADISLPAVRDQGFRVVKVIIPELHPFCLNERFPCDYSERLEHAGGKKAVEPHPFP